MVPSLRPTFLVLWLGISQAIAHAEPPTTAQRLVQAALQAEATAQNSIRAQLLHQAIEADPAFAAARWQAGYVKLADQWLTPEVAAQYFSLDKASAEYRRLRDTGEDSLEKHLLLARFCRQAKLADREQLHWSYVLQAQPKNIEARRALGLREYQGLLLTDAQIERYKQFHKETKALDDKWQPIVRAWRDKITGSDAAQRDEALSELRAVKLPEAISYLEAELSEASEELGLEVVALLQKQHDQPATASLARHAVLSSHAAVRTAAAKALRERPWQSYVPGLIANMRAPVEVSYFVNLYDSGIGFDYTVSLHQEVPAGVFESIENGGERLQTTIPKPNWANRRSAQLRLALLNQNYQGLQQQIVQLNRQSDALNGRIDETLSLATGQELRAEPQAWWIWWQEYNESYTPQVVYKNYHAPKYRTMMTCFLKGTQVWTELGAVPIERVRPGDRVLSQHPDTGELSYQLVQQTTVRPPAKSQWVRIGDDEILATLGHPFWVVGQGWRMTKQLEVGQHLHTPTGVVAIDKLEPGPQAEAYNLVVAGTGTYFVGQSKVLVHDNTPWVYTDVAVPGMRK